MRRRLLRMKTGEAKHVVESQHILFALLDRLKAWLDADESAKRVSQRRKQSSSSRGGV